MSSPDYILCECPLESLESFVASLEDNCSVAVVQPPSICTTLIRAEDSVEFQPFYLGEALTTECVLSVNGQLGYGLCLGDEPIRCYCIAFVDALLQRADTRVFSFLEEQDEVIAAGIVLEQSLIQKTKVDFKLMEQD